MAGEFDLPILGFEMQEEWREWLEKYHATEKGIWLKMFKKGSGVTSIVYAEALDEALCFGWIDGQARRYDEQSYVQRFVPRRSRSMWSKRNREHVARLIKEGKMMAAGLAQIESAKADGRWEQAYDSPATMEVPEDLSVELEKRPKAKEFYESLNKTNRYAIGWRLQTAKKPETRLRRMGKILEMLERGEKWH